MPSFLIKKIPRSHPEHEEIYEAVDRVINDSNKNFDKVKRLLYGNLDFVNMQERGIKGDRLEKEAVTAEEIAANSVTADKIEAGAITAEKIDVEELSSISANIGEITAGTIDAAQASIINIDAGNITTGTLEAIEVIGIYGSFDGDLIADTILVGGETDVALSTVYTSGGETFAIADSSLGSLNRMDIVSNNIYIGALGNDFTGIYTDSLTVHSNTTFEDHVEFEEDVLMGNSSYVNLPDGSLYLGGTSLPSGSFTDGNDNTIYVSSGLITSGL